MTHILRRHNIIRSDVVLKTVLLLLLLLSFYGLAIFPLTQTNWDFVLFPLLLVFTLPFINLKSFNSKLIITYVLLVCLSCLYSYFYNHQAIHLVTIHSYKYFALLFFFYLVHTRATAEEAERILIVISVVCCTCYILQWLIYPTVLFTGAAEESKASLEHYRVRIPGSISCYCLFLYGVNKYITKKRIGDLLYSVLGGIPILIMGFRTLSALSVILVFLMIPFITRQVRKSLKYLILAVIIGYGALQTDLVKSKVEEMVKRQESGQNFDNENYIRYRELDYYWNEYFTKPGEKIFGGGAPVDMSTNYRKDIYYNNYAFTDLGLVGLGLIIGFPAVLLLVLCYVKCIWRFKEPKFQYLRFTLLLVLLGSLFTTSELYRTGNILLFSLFVYVEYINSRRNSPVLKK